VKSTKKILEQECRKTLKKRRKDAFKKSRKKPNKTMLNTKSGHIRKNNILHDSTVYNEIRMEKNPRKRCACILNEIRKQTNF